MAYLGNRPAESFASFEKQVFTIVNSQTAYTLSHSVTNENDIRLVVNNVVQEPGSGKAYTASGTTLTLSAALTNGTDTMYCVFLGRALQTVNAPNASVGSDQTAPTIITGQTAEATVATDDTILIHDTSASALRKMTRANFVSGIGGTNTPAFAATYSGDQTLNSNTTTKIEFTNELFDSGSVYDTSNSRFTPGVAGQYNIKSSFWLFDDSEEMHYAYYMLYKNGSQHTQTQAELGGGNDYKRYAASIDFIIESDADDYFEIYLNVTTGDSGTFKVSGSGSTTNHRNMFSAFKLIQ